MKLTIINNIQTPYRKKLFDKIKERSFSRGVDFRVYYLSDTESVRDWGAVELGSYEAIFDVLFQVRNKLTTTSDIIFNYGYFSKVICSDVTIFFGYSYTTYIVGASLRKLFGKKNVLFCESTKSDSRTKGLIFRIKRFIIRSIFDTFLVPGVESRKYLVDLGVEAREINIAVNSSELRPRLDMETSKDNEIVSLLYVGRLSREKRIVETIIALKECSLDFTMKVVGSGELNNEVLALVKGDDRFELLGALNQDSLSSVYSSSDILILPSKLEPWGLVVNEAINFGLAVLVSSNVGCRHELVKDNGLTFESDNFSDMIDKLAFIIEDLSNMQKKSTKLSQLVTGDIQADSFIQPFLKGTYE
ncbi:glycosyltransferase family 4 protein [Vibrio splendidus]